MARGNIYLGKARGSIGDLTLYMQRGIQFARARNRNPRNPRSNPQLLQRAIVATCVRAYSAGKVIFDHSFEGKSVGSDAMNRFLHLNTRRLRSLFKNDFSHVGSDSFRPSALAVEPKSVYPVLNSYVISEGSLRLTGFAVRNQGQSVIAVIDNSAVEPNMTKEEVLDLFGWKGGDIFTICTFCADEVIDSPQSYCQFGFVRLQVNEVDPHRIIVDNQGMFTCKFKDLFYISSTTSDVRAFDEKNLGETIIPSDIYTGYNIGAMGVIRSRVDSPLRSPCTMTFPEGLVLGANASNVLQIWQNSASSILDSSLILEGGVVEVSA